MEVQTIRRGAFAAAGLNRRGKANGEDLTLLVGRLRPADGRTQTRRQPSGLRPRDPRLEYGDGRIRLHGCV